VTSGFFGETLEGMRKVVVWSALLIFFLSVCLILLDMPRMVIVFVEEKVLTSYPLFIFSIEEAFVLKLTLAFLGGIFLSFPIIFAITYFNSQMMRNRGKMLVAVIVPMILLFAVGIAFGYFFLLPTMLSFFIKETLGVAEPQMNLGGAVSIVVFTLLVFGISFEFPLITSILAYFRIITHKTLLAYWRHAIVLIVVWAGIITPDVSPISQSIIAVPMVVLYFAGILLAKLFS